MNRNRRRGEVFKVCGKNPRQKVDIHLKHFIVNRLQNSPKVKLINGTFCVAAPLITVFQGGLASQGGWPGIWANGRRARRGCSMLLLSLKRCCCGSKGRCLPATKRLLGSIRQGQSDISDSQRNSRTAEKRTWNLEATTDGQPEFKQGAR
jgi:hypothetical protein